MTPKGYPWRPPGGTQFFYYMKIEGSKPAIYEWVKKLWFGDLKGGPKDFQKDAKENWIRLFFDPPGPLKLFSHSFSAWTHGVCEHSDFFLKLRISQNIFKFHVKVAKSLGRSQIWWKTGWTNFGHFRTWKIHCFDDVFIAMGVSSNWKFNFFKLHMILGSNFIFVKDRAQKEGFHHHFLGKNQKQLFFPIFFDIW